MVKVNLLDKLKRSTNAQNFISEIDGFRFLAIFPVCLMHFNTWFSRSLGRDYELNQSNLFSLDFYVMRGGLGVDIFFAISGFILGFPFIRAFMNNEKIPKLSDYYMRRVTRLEPPYIISLILLLLAHLFINSEHSVVELWNSFLASLFYSHYFIFGTWSIINPVTWSLETEIQFYILAPFLCSLLFRNKTNRQWIVLVASTILIFIFLGKAVRLYPVFLHLSNSILAYLPNFLVGFIVAAIYIKNKQFLLKKSYKFDVLGVFSFYILFLFIYTKNIAFSICFIVALFFLFLSIFKGKILNKFFRTKIVYVIGGMCYTIYLLHYVSFYFIGKLTSFFIIGSNYWANYLLQILVVFPILFAVCCVFFLLIEKPCMNKHWPKKLWSKIKSNHAFQQQL